tara:strand:- start:371 stop:1183 length:813 start_codon:yes stop_codon:yes gene_type:complete
MPDKDINNKTLMDYFGEKSSSWDEKEDLMDLIGVNPDTKQLLNTMLLLGIDPGKKKSLAMRAGSAVKRSGKSLMDIFDEILGRGKKSMDEVTAYKPLDTSYITGRNPSAVTMQDILAGNKKSLDIPAFEREALGLTKRVSSGKAPVKPYRESDRTRETLAYLENFKRYLRAETKGMRKARGAGRLSEKELRENVLKKNQADLAKFMANKDIRRFNIKHPFIEDIPERSFLPALIRQQGVSGPGMPSNRATSDIMKTLESISKMFSKGPFD